MTRLTKQQKILLLDLASEEGRLVRTWPELRPEIRAADGEYIGTCAKQTLRVLQALGLLDVKRLRPSPFGAREWTVSASGRIVAKGLT